jgi:hypothetical protein
MSAYIVSPDHITALLAGFAAHSRRQRCRPLSEDDLSEIGRQLLLENCRSVAYRYDTPVDDGWQDYRFDRKYLFRPPVRATAQLLKLCDCLEYQSCERDDWYASAAFRKLDEIRSVLISSLPGYEQGPWEFHFDKEAA